MDGVIIFLGQKFSFFGTFIVVVSILCLRLFVIREIIRVNLRKRWKMGAIERWSQWRRMGRNRQRKLVFQKAQNLMRAGLRKIKSRKTAPKR